MAFTAPKASTTARGYGGQHAKARRAAAKQHQPSDPCVRCKQPLGPMSSALHYDHDGTRTGYLGFSHAQCNVRAGAIKGARVANGKSRTVSDALRW